MKTHLYAVILWIALAAMPAHAAQDIPILFLSDEVVLNSELPEQETFFHLFKQVFSRNIPQKFSARFIPVQQAGMTASSVLQIMPDILKHRPHVAIVALGHAEAKQGVDPDLIHNGLEQLVEQLKQHNVYVVLLGVRAPETASLSYASRFNTMYSEIAQRHQVYLYPDVYYGLREHRDTFVPNTLTPTKYGVNYAISALTPYIESIAKTVIKRY